MRMRDWGILTQQRAYSNNMSSYSLLLGNEGVGQGADQSRTGEGRRRRLRRDTWRDRGKTLPSGMMPGGGDDFLRLYSFACSYLLE